MNAVYGCHNREPLRDEAVVRSGWIKFRETLTPVRVRIPDEMSKDCQYTKSDLGQADAKCDGCKHRAGRTPVDSES